MNFVNILKTWFNLFWTILIHKYYIFVWGLRLKVPIYQLVTHDCSKFCSDEWDGYLELNSNNRSDQYLNAWLHHQNTNKHHYQYWILRDNGKVTPLPMPIEYVKEMVCDWIAANKSYQSDELSDLSNELLNFKYFEKNHMNIIKLSHQITLKQIVIVLDELSNSGYHFDDKIISLFRENIKKE